MSSSILRLPGSTRPSDGSPLEPVATTPPGEIPAIVARARAAQHPWSELALGARSNKVRALGRLLLERRQEGIDLLCQEMGRSPTDSLMLEFSSLDKFVEMAVAIAHRALRPTRVPLPRLEFPGKSAVIEAVPRGVIGIIAPWNYPLVNFSKHLLPALLSGNGVVLKPSEHTPRTGAWLAARCRDVFGPDLVGLVQGRAEAGDALIAAGVDAICFTGSVATGRKVSARAGELLIPSTVELGGKDAAIVLSDCDLERTLAGIAQWALSNAGQDCSSIERVYVEKPICDEFVRRLAKFVSSLSVSPAEPGDLGPLQNERQLQIVEEHVAEAVSKGARVVVGGKRTGSGLGYCPTVLDGCTDDMRILREETFGPVIAVRRIDSAEEGIRLANESTYGLNGSIWTRDLKRGAALARQLQVGVALVNNHSIPGIIPWVPWTGVKGTGPGIANSEYAYGNYVRRRTVFVDRNKNPDPWWRPADENLHALGEALAQRGLGRFVLPRLAGLLLKRVKTIREAVKKTA